MTDRGLSDVLLIERAQKGDRSAFDMLVTKYEAKAYQYAFRLTRNQEEACDVVADAFVRVYNALHNFKGQSAFSTWMYRILTNCFLDIRKKQSNKPTSSLEATLQTSEGEVEREFEDHAPSPLDETERNERVERIEKAVRMLPEFQRAMIVMYHGENLTYEEIAASLDLPVGTVKSRLNRARLSLRELLMKDAELFQA